MALAPGFRTDFRESLYRMIVALTGAGVTILSTVETEDTFTGFTFSHYTISFLTDDIISLHPAIEQLLRRIKFRPEQSPAGAQPSDFRGMRTWKLPTDESACGAAKIRKCALAV